MSTTTVNTRFLVISDTHGLELQGGTDHPFRLPLPHADVLLHCGDLTQNGCAGPFKKVVKMLGELDAELKLVIAGNHDTDLDREYCAKYDEEEDNDIAVNIMKGPLASDAGVIYLDEGTHHFTLKNGAKLSIYVSPYTPAFGDFAFMYEPEEDRFSGPEATNPVQSGVDIMMTHGPAHGILDQCENGSVGCPMLLKAVQRVRPQMHCFGHIHQGHGAQLNKWQQIGTPTTIPSSSDEVKALRYATADFTSMNVGEETLSLNAAIQNDDREPSNAPWVVDLALPRA